MAVNWPGPAFADIQLGNAATVVYYKVARDAARFRLEARGATKQLRSQQSRPHGGGLSFEAIRQPRL